MKLLRIPVLNLTLATLSIISLNACVSEDQQAAQETVIASKQDEDTSLPPEAISDIAAESVTNTVTKEKTPALTPDDIEADNDPMKIGFETARWNLSDIALGRIKDVAEKMKDDVSITLKIDGHCDERGSDGYNQELSVKRAEAVRKELVRLGVPSKRMKAKGYGAKRQLEEGHTEKVYSHNRRVEMIFSK
jgi:outer membrane protein OmpA-like peptidoglycan-associated protein